MTVFIGQVCRFVCNFTPLGWLTCDEKLHNVSEYPLLFQLIGYSYGGSGGQFGVPNLVGRVPLGIGQGRNLSNYALAQTGGLEQVTIDSTTDPAHGHTIQASSAGATAAKAATSLVLAQAVTTTSPAPYTGAPVAYASPGGNQILLDPGTVSTVGGNTIQAHENRQPYMALTYCIAHAGIYPTA